MVLGVQVFKLRARCPHVPRFGLPTGYVGISFQPPIHFVSMFGYIMMSFVSAPTVKDLIFFTATETAF